MSQTVLCSESMPFVILKNIFVATESGTQPTQRFSLVPNTIEVTVTLDKRHQVLDAIYVDKKRIYG